MNPIELTCNSDGTMSIGIKQGFHVYTEEENSKILGVVEHLKAENERLRSVEANNIVLTSINDKLRDLVLQFYKVTQVLRCHEVDNWYCNNECPLGIGKDSCTITELADKAKELGIDVFLD